MPPQVITIVFTFMEATWNLDTLQATYNFPDKTYTVQEKRIASNSHFAYAQILSARMEVEWWKYLEQKELEAKQEG